MVILLENLQDQLGAVVKLLSTMKIGGTIEEQQFKNQGEAEATTGFLSGIERRGWSIGYKRGRTKTYWVSQRGQSVEMWLKFSACHEATGKYWFGIASEDLESRSSQEGGVVLMLGASNRYLCFPFAKLLELLRGATKTRTGQKFQVREESGRFAIQPGGTNKWIDVSSSYNNLSRIDLD